jgi:hypothetical protein
MSLDPKTLKKGDVVVFGGQVEKTVYDDAYRSPTSSSYIISFGAIDSWHYDTDPLWQIAELKKLEFPSTLGKTYGYRPLFCVNSDNRYDPSDASNWHPSALLRGLKESARQLVAAGVKEKESEVDEAYEEITDVKE